MEEYSLKSALTQFDNGSCGNFEHSSEQKAFAKQGKNIFT